MSLRVIKPGLLSSLQDRGRYGHQHLGVSPSGAMDERAHRLAHLLAGNSPDKDLASLEITISGPTLVFEAACLFALAGAELNATLDGMPVSSLRPILAKAGQTLALHSARPGQGARAYLAVYGGFAVDPVLGSQSTHMRVGLGGWEGRALRKGDVVPLACALPTDASVLDDIHIQLDQLRPYMPAALTLPARDQLRVVLDEQADLFTSESLTLFETQAYRISPASERMGYRLEGQPLQRGEQHELLSAPTGFGTIQVPNDGQPIVLMADRQTTGGYPRIAQVASVDLAQLAQRLPGQTIRFEIIALEQAMALSARQEKAFLRLSDSLESWRLFLSSLRS